MTQRPPGPAEATAWPSELPAHVVTPGADPRLYGYSVERDVARHGAFAEAVLLSLRGELPQASECRAFEIALTFLAPLSVAEAPVHAAVLGRLCGARSSAVVSIAAVTLAERARQTLETYAPVLAWLDEPTGSFPEAFRAASNDDREAVARLAELLDDVAPSLTDFRVGPDRTAALLAVFHAVGLKRREQLEPVFVLASLAPALAEAFAWQAGAFHEYPMLVPRFEYVEGDDAG